MDCRPGLFRQSTFGRLGGYEEVNDVERLGMILPMRLIVGKRGRDEDEEE